MTSVAASTRRRVRAVSVEEELLLVDAVTMYPTPAPGTVLQRREARGAAPSMLGPSVLVPSCGSTVRNR
jgi:hypothetical protein